MHVFVYVCRREDAGLLVYKDHLPVSQVVVGDMSRSGSEAKLTVGPLTCQGDRECLSLHTHSSVFNDISVEHFIHILLLFSEGNFWNTASFSSPASYLHFPSFRGETSADISFYFKTASSHGIFLENLGATNFLHIELRGECVC